MRPSWLLYVTLALAGLTNWSEAWSEVLSKSAVERVERDLKAKPRVLRPAINRSLCQFVRVAHGYASYTYPDSPLYPPDTSQIVTITKLELHPVYVKLRVRSKKVDASIAIEPAAGELLSVEDMLSVLSEVFEDFRSNSHPAVIGNRSSHLYHVFSTNHRPEENHVVGFDTIRAAESAGYAPCTACFVSRPKVTDFHTERMLGNQWAGEVRRSHPLVPKGPETTRVDSLGRHLLSHWPTALKGYDYIFRIVEDQDPNAFACPTGYVFVTSGLLSCIEDEEELKGILAHEICHVERRHGYRQFLRTQRAVLIATIVGVAVGVASDNRGTGAAVTAMATLASAAILSGYSRTEEAEADTYALVALGLNADSEHQALSGYEQVLSKLQQYDSFEGRARVMSNGFRSHPAIETRISRAKVSAPQLFPKPFVFVGYDSDDNPLLAISFESQVFSEYSEVVIGGGDVDLQGRQRHFKGAGLSSSSREPKLVSVRELVIFASVAALPELNESVKVSEVNISFGGTRHLLDNREDTELFPGDDAGMSFVSSREKSPLDGEPDSFMCSIPGVVRWERQQ